MAVSPKYVFAFVTPVYSEAAGLINFHDTLLKVVQGLSEDYEIILCGDGSRDTADMLQKIRRQKLQVPRLALANDLYKDNAFQIDIKAITSHA